MISTDLKLILCDLKGRFIRQIKVTEISLSQAGVALNMISYVLTHPKLETGSIPAKPSGQSWTRWKLPQTVAALRSFSGAGS